jgi:hypothetical protein
MQNDIRQNDAQQDSLCKLRRSVVPSVILLKVAAFLEVLILFWTLKQVKMQALLKVHLHVRRGNAIWHRVCATDVPSKIPMSAFQETHSGHFNVCKN